MYLDNAYAVMKKFDPEMASLTEREEARQLETLCLIASENYVSPMAAGLEGSVWANKNAEGYPAGRFVAGCELADRVENLTKERIKKIFGCDHVNVQVMSATVGNVAILRALLKPGDLILSMELAQGGHLSHGASFHASGQDYKVIHYGLNPETEVIDMEQVEKLAEEHMPKMIICGASSYPRQIDYKKFGEIAKKVGAYLFADIAHPVGLIAAGVIPSPVPHADVISTSTHKTWRGPRGGGVIMCTAELAKRIDYRVFPGIQGAPKMDMIAARGVLALESMTDCFKKYQQQVYDNAQAFADELKKCGLRLVSGGTDTHLILVDVRDLIPSGKEAEELLESVGIVVNKNMIPYDPQSPKVTSGIRIGTPALTTRGMLEEDFREVARLLADTLKQRSDADALMQIKTRVKEVTAKYPMFADKWLGNK